MIKLGVLIIVLLFPLTVFNLVLGINGNTFSLALGIVNLVCLTFLTYSVALLYQLGGRR